MVQDGNGLPPAEAPPAPCRLLDLSNQELQELRTHLKTILHGIQTQLEQWNAGSLPDHLMTDDWAKRARSARGWNVKRINLARQEITRRRLEHEDWMPPKETPEQKAARIATTEQAQRTKEKAFVRAAYRLLSSDEIDAIWASAKGDYMVQESNEGAR